uniref:Ubiquitin-like domain-containing protein n=1 Tax=Caenorhabditis tropicalis TaxID=1561998 RepID=A0A1I7TFE0_9PELO
MELFIVLHDHDGTPHKKFRAKFTKETNLDQLNAEIQKTWRIEIKDQQLFLDNGEEIFGLGERSLQSFGLNNGSTVVVKHVLLTNWRTYLEGVDEIRKLTSSGETSSRKRIAVQGRRQLSPLDDSDFFSIYPNLVKKRREIDNEINFLVHNSAKYLKRAIENYYKNYEVEIVQKPKKAAGVQHGFFVRVKNKSNGICKQYYAKTVGAQPKAEFAPGEKLKIDLIELFLYQLLSLIGFGAPEVHILPDSTNSDSVYLSTALSFRMASGYLVDELLENPKASKKETFISGEAQNQFNIIAGLLGLVDLLDNKGKYGMVERKTACDEREGGTVDVADLAQGPRIPKSTTTTSLKDYVERWELRKHIQEAKKLILENEAIRNTDNKNLPQFEFYLKQIEENLKNIQ